MKQQGILSAMIVTLAFAGLFLLPTNLLAGWQIEHTDECINRMRTHGNVVPKRIGNFSSREECVAMIRRIVRETNGAYSFEDMTPVPPAGYNDGQDQQKRERQFREEMERQRAVAEQRWREEEASRRLNEKKRLREALANAQTESLKLLSQRPGDTSFFGLDGGLGPGKPASGVPVVDLRHLRKASYFARAVETASPEDLELLLDEALKAANGDASSYGPVPAGAELPEIDESGLRAFQKANFEYAKTHDLQLICAEALKTTRQQRDLARQKAEAERAEVERQMAGKTDEASLREKRERLAAIDAKLEAGEDAARRAEDLAAVAADQAYWNREEAVRVLRALAQGKNPDEFHPPIASLPSLKEETWRKWEQRNQEETKLLEEQTGKLRKGLGSYVPPLKEPEQVHLGVILGFGTDQAGAQAMEENGVCCFTGKTFKEMNDAAVKARAEGKTYAAGVKVVSFGTDKSRPENPFDPFRYAKDEAGRVMGDHLTSGEVSLSSPQGRQAVDELAGKHFTRLMAHSNGASVAEALIRSDLIEVNELHVVGGDRSLLNGKAYQELLDSGKVKRVVVWYNVNDPVPWVTSAAQLPHTGLAVSDAAAHLTKKIIGVQAGGNDGVQYRPMVGRDYRNPDPESGEGIVSKGFDKLLSAHYIQSSYMPGMANENGVKYNIPKYVLKGK